MIKDIFLPEKIGSNYLFSKRIIGFDIGKTQIYSTQLKVSGKTFSVEKTIIQPIENDNSASYQKRASDAIKKILEQVDKYDEICTSISSFNVVFKKLKS